MTALSLKLLRDLRHLWAQVAAVALVVACGVALFVTLRSMHEYLLTTQARYYDEYRFADLFATIKRAPEAVGRQAAGLPGVAAAETRIVFDVLLDVPGLAEPPTGRLVSVPEAGQPRLNALHLRRGRWIDPDRRDEVLVSEAFARANHLEIGDTVGAVLRGQWRRLRIVGIALSPEYIYEIRGAGEVFPDNRRFGVLWMGRKALASAFDLDGAFNDLVLELTPGASEPEVIARLDRLLARHGSLGSYGREDQISHVFVSSEITETRITSVVIPAIFLGVTAFLVHIVLSRLVGTQRDQIAVLKAFGYRNRAVGLHYLKLALVPVLAGSALGIGAGLWLAVQLAGVYARFYQFPVLRYEPEPAIAGLALLIGGGAAVLGALDAVRRAVSLPPAEAMRPEAPARFRSGLMEHPGFERLVPVAGRMVIRGLERRPGKAFLSTLGIALAVGIVVAGMYTFDAVDVIKEIQFELVQREDVTVSFQALRPAAARHELSRLPGVLRVETFRAVPVRLRSGHRAERTAILGLPQDAELHQMVGRDRVPRPLPAEGLLLTAWLAERLGVRPGDTLTAEILEGERPLRTVAVGGIVDELVGASAYMDLRSLDRLAGDAGTISGAWLAIDANRSAELYSRLERLPGVAAVGVREAALSGFEKTIAESFRISIVTIIGFACVISFGVIYNGARIALSERGRELASLRILGFSRREVATMLLGEQALLTAAAIPLGLGLGYAMCALITLRSQSELFRIPLVLTAETYLFALAVVVAAAFLSGLAVRRRLDRLDLVAVLKTRE